MFFCKLEFHAVKTSDYEDLEEQIENNFFIKLKFPTNKTLS